jgi:hypothetical protein
MPDLIKEHLQQEVISDVKLLLRDLWKIIKVLSIYPADSPTPRKMRASFGSRFVELVSQYNGLSFLIRSKEIIYDEEVVYADNGQDDAMATMFYSAGVVVLEFAPRLNEDEADTFIDVIRMAVTGPVQNSDLVSLLWQEQFEYIKFKTVDDLALDKYNTGKIILEQMIFKDGNAAPEEQVFRKIISDQPQPVIVDDANIWWELSGESSLTGGIVPPTEQSRDYLFRSTYLPAEEEEREIHRLLEENRTFDPYRTVTRILLEILHIWDNSKLLIETVGICEKTLDQLLVTGAFSPAADFVHAIRALHEDIKEISPEYGDRLADFLRSAGDMRRIQQLTDIINQQESFDPGTIQVYLESLGWESLPHISGMLGKLVSKKARLMICDFLTRNGRDHLAIIANGIQDKRWYVVRNSAMILGQIGGDNVLNYLEATVTHPDLRVRRETIRALAGIKSERAVALLGRFCHDREARLRALCLTQLGHCSGRQAFEIVREIVMHKDFKENAADELELFLIAFSRLGGAEAVPHLVGIVDAFGLIVSEQSKAYRIAALKALAHNPAPEVPARLEGYTRSKRGWMKDAARGALEYRRRLGQRIEGTDEHSSD